MTKLHRFLIPSAAAAALVASGFTIAGAVAPPSAQAQVFSQLEARCTNDACATFRCHWGDCHRVSAWRDTDRVYDRGYYYNDYTTIDRCDGDQCATFHCYGADNTDCTRVGAWHYRY
jgi:hypothetical protein